MAKLTLLVMILISFGVSGQPKISFTFDDGNTNNKAHYQFEEWNQMILHHLDDAQVKAIFFVTGFNKLDEKGRHLLKTWDESGHKLGNHTYSHPNYNSDKTTFEKFELEILQTDKIIKNYTNYVKLFRFPYLKEGNTPEKVNKLRERLASLKYKNGHVTIDASDWYIDSRLVKRLKNNPKADLEGFKNYYITHLFDRATFYEKLSYELNGRHINHTLLLHHNLAAALFLDDLIAYFKTKGWEIISADEAYEDPVFDTEIDPEFAGESIIWGMAKASGKYEQILRYPAEGKKYEEDKMNALGL